MHNSDDRDTESRHSELDRGERNAAMKRNSILIIILSVIVVVAAVAGLVMNLGGKESTKKNPSSTAESAEAESSVSIDENTNALEENKYPEVNDLIANYRKAFKEGDTDLLKKVYNSDQEINADVLTATSQIIEDYKNTQYYTKRGLNSGEYVVFVYDELKLADIKTLAPNLSVFYVKTADDGSLYIYRGDYNAASGSFEYDEKTQNYINQLYQDQDVMDLISTVNTKMDSACANDSSLMEFMQKVRSKTKVTDTSSAETGDTSSTESGQSETESQTATETESASETESQTDGSDAAQN